MRKILVVTDGEELAKRAEHQALALARALGAEVVGLYVLSPYLKKFTDEIYAVGRNECRDHLDASLRREGGAALDAFAALCREAGVTARTLIREGDIPAEIVAEAAEGGYDLAVMGAKRLEGLRQRLESVNAPADVFKRCPIPMLFVR